MKSLRFLALACGALLGGGGEIGHAQELATLRWDHQLDHYTPAEAPAYDAWIITPSEPKSEDPRDFGAVLDDIFHRENPRLSHIYLRGLTGDPDLQDDVMSYILARPDFQAHPSPKGFNRWAFQDNTRMRALVEQGVLHSRFVADCNALLARYGREVEWVSMEELFFVKKEGRLIWDAGMWLILEPRRAAGGSGNGFPPHGFARSLAA
jgi:hypothetical protein